MEHQFRSSQDRDQAARLRELMSRVRPGGTVLAVTSGKGGVGKSNLAVNLSICLAANRLRVTLVDIDMGLANADLLMNLQPRHNLAHVLAGLRTLESVCMEGPGGIRFVPGVSGTGEVADLSEFERRTLVTQLNRLRRSADIVVLDCGAGIARNVIGFARAADSILVVTTPQPPAVTDAYATIKVLYRERYTGHLGVFVNMANSRAQAEATYHRLAGVAQRFLKYPVAYSGYMLHDTAVDEAVQERSPFVLRSPGANATAAVAALAARMSQGHQVPADRGGLLRRVAGLFV